MRVDSADKVWLDSHRRPVVNAFCGQCNKLHGHRFIPAQSISITTQEGWYQLYLNDMLFWNGNQEVLADTIEAVPEKMIRFTIVNINQNRVVRIGQNPMTRFYMCRSCGNHLVSYENKLFMDTSLGAIICKDAVNMRVDSADKVWLDRNRRPVVNASCSQCNQLHGHQFLRAKSISLTNQEGWYRLFLKQMLLWDGSQVVFADTLQPVPQLVSFTVGPLK
ncbi:Yippee-like protein [Corchorus olitorius]|uniref:Yippee-like protein n=1 Tax=Corchorus olitorius TaxID=93759 RepID=A0A1R3IF76_9ROSI|nr:Yippee-like protein [Corchorus olitorius]